MRKNKSVSVLVVLAAVTMLLGIATTFYASKRAGQIHGPQQVSVDRSGSVYVISDGTVYVFDDLGTRRQTVLLGKFGVGKNVSDLLPTEDGDWLLADDKTGDIKRCNPVGGECLLLSDRLAARVGRLKPPVKMALDDANHRLFIADSGNHRLVSIRLNGDVLDATDPRSALFSRPGALRVEGGHLIVADTDNQRLVEVALNGDRFGAIRALTQSGGPLLRRGHGYPTAFGKLPSGSMVVVSADKQQAHGDMIEYSISGEPVRLIGDYAAQPSSHLSWGGLTQLVFNHLFGWEADPRSVALLEDRLLVADPTLMQVNSAPINGGEWAGFGDSAFQADLEQLGGTLRFWLKWKAFGVLLSFVAATIAVKGLVRGLRVERIRPGQDVPTRNLTRFAAPTMVLTNGVHWIDTNRGTLRLIGRGVCGIGLVAVLILAGAMLGLFDPTPVMHRRDGGLLATWLPVGVLILVLFAVWLLKKYSRYKIGTDGHVLYFLEPNGIQRSIALTNVRYTPHRIWVGGRWLAYRTPAGEIFPRHDLRRYVFAQLPASARMQEWEAIQEWWRALLANKPWLRVALPVAGLAAMAGLLAH